LSAEQEEAIKDKKCDRVLKLKEQGIVTSEKVVELLNSEKIFTLDLDPNEVEDQLSQDGKTADSINPDEGG
jgi:hypothetical protein